MFLNYARYYDRVMVPKGHAAHEVLWRFLVTLALWPWPLPFTTANMDALCPTEDTTRDWDGVCALEGSVGRRMASSLVVPLPCGGVWNVPGGTPATVPPGGHDPGGAVASVGGSRNNGRPVGSTCI